MTEHRRHHKTRRGEGDAPPDPAKRRTLKKLAALGLLGLVDMGALVSCGRRAVTRVGRERKVILLGLDGLSPHIIEKMMERGKLPHFARLREMGSFRALNSTIPPQSPVAWASVIAGSDPGRHGIYDFIQRDPETYLPYLSIARTEPPSRVLPVGKWRIPISRGKVELLRRGPAFWELLSARGVPCQIYRVPSNFPPQECGAKQLAGLGAPDLRGTYGEYSYFTERPTAEQAGRGGGSTQQVKVDKGVVRAKLIGPDNSLQEGGGATAVDFTVYLDRANRTAKLVLQDNEVVLKEGEWSDWLPVRFPMLPHLHEAAGICRVLLKEVSPTFKLYVTPINVDPMDPALPVTAPPEFAQELADEFGRFYTQGFPHDVKALRHGVLSDGEYLEQSDLAMSEARRMWQAALDKFDRGLLFHYFATTDRTQHMFWRTMDPRHPAYDERAGREYGRVIPDCYRTADEIVGEALEALDGDTTLIVMSDHGFMPYYRTFNLNTWLARQGLLAGVAPWTGGASIFGNADWDRTAAYAIGFNALYLNLEGREGFGSVDPADRERLLDRIAKELTAVRDPETGERVIERVHRGDQVYSDPGSASDRMPDLIVGYAQGYRCSDASVLGEVTEQMVEDNRDKWSGDHCIERALVPGMLFTSRPVEKDAPELTDVTASVLSEFGVEPGEGMTGRPLWREKSDVRT